MLNSQGDTKANLTTNVNSIIKLNDPTGVADFTTNTAGEKTYKFTYKNDATGLSIDKLVVINVLPKKITSNVINLPTKTTYLKGDTLDLTGSNIQFTYNNGTISGVIALTRDMFTDEVWTGATNVIGDNISVIFAYENKNYSFNIKVIENIKEVLLSSASNYYLNQPFAVIQGNSFDKSTLVLDVVKMDNSTVTMSSFDLEKWTFENTDFDEIGLRTVKIIYGDTSNNKFVDILVNVTNAITAFDFDTTNGEMDFGTIIEDQAITINDAYLLVTYENNDCVNANMLRVAITNEMLPQKDTYNKVAGNKVISVSYGGKVKDATVTVINRSLVSSEIVELPSKLKYVIGDTINLNGLKIRLSFDNGTTQLLDIVYNVDGTTVDLANSKVIIEYDSTISYEFIYSYDATWIDGQDYAEKQINLDIQYIVNSSVPTTSNTINNYNSHWFVELPENLVLLEKNIDDTYKNMITITAFEGIDKIEFPKEAILRVVYDEEDNNYNDYYLNEFYQAESNYINSDDYSLTGYLPNKVGNQTITINYIMYSCTFTINVKAKLLTDITTNVGSITIVEGMEITNDKISLTAHYIDADGNAFADPNFASVGLELSQVNNNYNSNDVVPFTEVQNTFATTVTFTFGGKEVTVDLNIQKKSLVSISWAQYPQRIYVEGYTSDINYEGGKLLVAFNNGTTNTVDLNSEVVTKDATNFDTGLTINDSGEVVQEIYVEYVYNSISKNTSYSVTIKDRKYLEVAYWNEANIINHEFDFIYGVTEDARPEFDVMDGNTKFIEDSIIDSKIAENIGFSVEYQNSLGERNTSWPKNVGLYTIVISYNGDDVYNSFEDTSMRLRIEARKIKVVANTITDVTYGDATINFVGHLESAELDNILYGFAEDENNTLDIGYQIYRGENLLSYAGGVVLFDATNNIFTYNICPIVQQQKAAYNNYEIVEFVSSEMEIAQKDIAIVADDSAEKTTKMYGENDPVFEYTVYDYDDYTQNPSTVTSIGNKYFDNINGIVKATITLNDAIININEYSLLRDYNDSNFENVGEHSIIRGRSTNINNFCVKTFVGASLTITSRPIALQATDLQKQFGFVTPNFEFIAVDEDSYVYNDDLTNVFAEQVSPSGYVLKFYSDIDCTNEITYNNDLPQNASVGTYYVKLVIDNELSINIKNYQVTTLVAQITIVKSDATVTLNAMTKNYGDDDPILTFENQYFYTFDDGYLLGNDDTYLVASFNREIGEDIGRYEYSLNESCINNNTNFNITLAGDKVLDIYPRSIVYNKDAQNSESYARKLLSSISVNYNCVDSNGYSLTDTDKTAISNAITYYWVGRNEAVQGTGVAVVDIYDVYVLYNFNNCKNFIMSNWLTYLDATAVFNMNNEIKSYITDNTPLVTNYQLRNEFVYEITPKDISLTFVYTDSYNYTGSDIPLVITDYSSNICVGDSLSIVLGLEAIYEQTVERVAVLDKKLKNAGTYYAKFIDIGNSNYNLSNVDYEEEMEVIPIEIQVEMKDGLVKEDESNNYLYNYQTSIYTGLPIRNDYEDSWIQNTVPSTYAENGYYDNFVFRIVSTGLTSAPNEILIRPNYNNNGVDDLPINVGTYDFKYFINNNYKNYEVKFVRKVEGSYVDAVYKYIITKRTINIENLTKYATKDYDGNMPSISNNAQLIIQVDNCATTEDINIDDIKFNFERNMDKVPTSLQGVITSDNLTNAGYFAMTAECITSNNFNCVLVDANEFEIKRINVPIKFNSSLGLLNKQYDMTSPIGTANMLAFSGGTAASYKVDLNNVYFDLDTKAYWDNSNWTITIPTKYDIGYYAYDFNPKCKVGVDSYVYFENNESEEFLDEISNKRLLDWNHTFSILMPSVDILNFYDGITQLYNDTDGIFKIEKRNICLEVTDGIEEIRDFEGQSDQIVYVYYQKYNKLPITKTNVLSFMNNFVAIDENGHNVATTYDFQENDMTCDDAITQIENTGERFILDLDAIISNNLNYNVTITNIIYEIEKLTVQLKATFGYSTIDNNSMIYSSDLNNIIHTLDFVNKQNFIDDLSLGETTASLDINNYIANSYDNIHFNTTGIGYVLRNSNNDIVYNSLDASHIKLGVGTYTSDIIYMSDNSKNFYLEFIPMTFMVMAKEIVINNIYRTYFNKQLSFNYTSSSPVIDQAEKNIVNDLLSKMLTVFIDMTEIDYDVIRPNELELYYATCSKTAINDVINMSLYKNYIVNFKENDIYNNDNNFRDNLTKTSTTINNYYVPIIIKKQDLQVFVVNNNKEPIHLEFGKKLEVNDGDFMVLTNGFSSLNTSATELTHHYDYLIEQNKQLSIKTEIENKILDLAALTDEIKKQNYNNGNIDTIDLNSYYNTIIDGSSVDLNTYFENYNIDLETAKFIIEKIQIILKLVNNNGTTYDENGCFTAIFDELGELEYSDEKLNPDRKSYDISVYNKSEIVGYEDGENYDLLDLFQKMEIFNSANIKIDSMDRLKNALEYDVYKFGFENVSAGICRLVLTNDWYMSNNYVLNCDYSSIIVYPKVKDLGDSGESGYYMPNTAAAMIGQDGDKDNFKDNLSMFVKLNYTGMPKYDNEWVDIRITDLTDENLLLYKEYRRSWEILLKDEDDLTQFSIGKEVELKLKFTETFYLNSPNPINNIIETEFFKVRLYGKEDISLIAGDSYFINGENVYNYGDTLDIDGTYTLGAYSQDDDGEYLMKNWQGKSYFNKILVENRYEKEYISDSNGLYLYQSLSFYQQITDVAERQKYIKNGLTYDKNAGGSYVKLIINGKDVYVDVNNLRYKYDYCVDPNGDYLLVNYPTGNFYTPITTVYRAEIQVVENSEGSYVLMDSLNGDDYYQQIVDSRRYVDELGTMHDNNGNYLLVNKFSGTDVYIDLTTATRYQIITDPKSGGNTLCVNMGDDGIYYTPIKDENRYKLDYFESETGNYFKVNIDDYFYNDPLLRCNVEYYATELGDYISIEGVYFQIKTSYKYIKNADLTYSQDDNGKYLKVWYQDNYEYILLSGRTKYNRNVINDVNGNYINLQFNIEDTTNKVVMVLIGDLYTNYNQKASGTYLKFSIFGNTYYELIKSDDVETEINESNRYNTNNFANTFDMLDTRFYFEPSSSSTTYYADMLLYEDATYNLKFRIDNQGYRLLVNDIVQTQPDAAVTSIQEVDLFDGYSHAMKLYIDKLGSNPSMLDNNESYYYLIVIIDDCYVMNFRFMHTDTNDQIMFDFDESNNSNVKL
ncbi:MAG: hypothetical protein WCR54_06930, partial [Clostridia bacterium]